MHLWDKESGKLADFNTNFSFIIYSEGRDSYSDGLTFFLASPDLPPPSPTDGVGIGLASREQVRGPNFLAAYKFVAVEFDTYRNRRWDPVEPVREHVGINVNNLTSHNSTPWYSVIKENGTYSASISYRSSTQNLNVAFTGFNNVNGTMPVQQHLSAIVGLEDQLPEWVEFGFSSSIGLATELHVLRSWSFESMPPFFIRESREPNKNGDDSKRRGRSKYFSCFAEFKWINHVINDGENLALGRAPSLEEVKDALFSILIDSSLGPDDFGSSFFRVCWDFVKYDIVEAIAEFFS
ncbi:hypothetical protein CIPAW_06G159500 [Carya illinoinensis]|uniref:Legume lectin domain-containing protein n=1 Tax=Carya illinoinensis TaxID=32201 RepID=A0A8T1QCH0_CARIL|nr:hypothetical protein CIPAW_06G159500 [Carya illinoinensis]